MAQLDRLLSVMISNRADSLILREEEAAVLLVEGKERPVTKALGAMQMKATCAPAAAPAAQDLRNSAQPTS